MEGIVVAARVREHKERLDECCITTAENKTIYVANRSEYTLNRVYRGQNQKEIYDDVAEPIVQKVLKNYNGCIMAYGQTGTGKTYTMGMGMDCFKTSSDDVGIVPRALKGIFSQTSNAGEISIKISCMEVYLEEVYDLLRKNPEKLQIMDFQPQGLTKVQVYSVMDACDLMEKAMQVRRIGTTNANIRSSRSHAIFSVHVIQKAGSGEISSKLDFVDLAGSEPLSEESEETRKEGKSINLGLHQLGNVMSALTSSEHVPYRNSVITTILKESVSSNNFISLIACISPFTKDVQETSKTLQFATRCGFLRQKPTCVNLTPFKKPFTPNRRTAPLPGNRPRPALRNLNNTLDSPRAVNKPKSDSVMKQWPPSSTPVPNFSNSGKFHLTPDLTPMHPPRPSVNDSALHASMNEDLIRSVVVEMVRSDRALISDIVRQEMALFRKELTSRILSENTCAQLTEESPPPPKLRRSLRLSFGKNAEDTETFFHKKVQSDLDQESAQTQILPGRRMMEGEMDMNSETSNNLVSSPELFKLPAGKGKNDEVPSTCRKVRRSVRLSVLLRKNYSILEKSSPIQRNRRKTIVFQNTSISVVPPPCSNENQNQHNLKILHILQNGNAKLLQTLPTIGPKTAVIISNARLIYGRISTLQELSNIPGLGKTFPQRFFWANNIKLD